MLSTRLIDDLVALLDPGEAHPPGERQVFLGRIDDLQQMAVEAGAGKAGERRVDGLERRQKIADQHQLAGARQRLEGGQARLAVPACPRAISSTTRDSAMRPLDRRHAAAEQGQPLAAAHQQARQRHQQQFGALALGRPVGAGDVPAEV